MSNLTFCPCGQERDFDKKLCDDCQLEKDTAEAEALADREYEHETAMAKNYYPEPCEVARAFADGQREMVERLEANRRKADRRIA